MWLLLPRGTARGRSIGAVLAVIAFGLGASQMPLVGDWVAQSVFSILAGVTVVAAAATVSFRNPVYCAIWFGLDFVGRRRIVSLDRCAILGRRHHRSICRSDFGDVFVCAHAGPAGRQGDL